MAPVVSVIVPVFRSETTLVALHDRLTDVLPADHEIVFVDDASPDASSVVLERLANVDPRVRMVRHHDNRGQHAAVLSGLGQVRGDEVVVLDADGQDPPEAIPAMLTRLGAPDRPDAVFALRRGAYEPRGRRMTARTFRTLLWLASRGRLPAGAGMFVALRGDLAGRLAAASAADGRPPYVVGLIGRTAVHAVGIPVERAPATATAYTSTMRMTIGVRALREAVRR